VIPIWAGVDPPAPVPTATPVPTPRELDYVGSAGAAFTVIDSHEADTLFAAPATCTNPVRDYTISYPFSWFTNDAFDSLPACSWFAPVQFAIDDVKDVPSEVAIWISVFPGASGTVNQAVVSLYEEVTIDGYSGWRREQTGTIYEGGGFEAQLPGYAYVAVLGPERAVEPTLRAFTASDGSNDYELNKAVLDRMMARFDYGP
jgi:hypothetical protein